LSLLVDWDDLPKGNLTQKAQKECGKRKKENTKLILNIYQFTPQSSLLTNFFFLRFSRPFCAFCVTWLFALPELYAKHYAKPETWRL
jgi:hypothetical protein